MLVRYGAVALVLGAAMGLRHFAGKPPSPAPDDLPVAAASLSSLAPLPSQAQAGVTGALRLSSPGLDHHAPFRNYPARDTFSVEGRAIAIDYAADSLIHARIGVYLQRYRPDAAVVLVSDLRTGRILGVGERSDTTVATVPRLALRSGFPAASLIKILTATAALELRGKGPEDSIPQLGSYHTLYRRQLLVGSLDRAPKVTLQEAFSRSVNPAFGVLGQGLGGAALQRIAGTMGFNRTFACVQPSSFQAPDTGFALAETACGFTSKTTISPLHALAIARGIGHDGRLRFGSFARSLTDLSAGRELAPKAGGAPAFVSPANLPGLQAMMEATVRRGTARKGFHQVMRASQLERLDVGGKTGSLDGPNPRFDSTVALPSDDKGRYDWFIGYARMKDDPTRGLALSIMLVHGEYANVRSTVLAALLVRDWLAAETKARKRDTEAATASAAKGSSKGNLAAGPSRGAGPGT